MRKIVHSLTLLLVACALLGGVPTVQASHLLGCDMTYTSLGNNQYRVKFRLYRDCSGITASSFTLNCRTGGCNSPTVVTATLTPQGTPLAALPLCPSNTATCANPSGEYPLYDFVSYEATVALPPNTWTMSVREGNRPDIGNLIGGQGNFLYTEAFLDNRGTSVVNTSPQFDPQDIPIQYVCVNQLTTFGFSAIEPDGDSLVYSLAAPLDNCGVPIGYKPYPGAAGGSLVFITRNPLCVLEILGLAGGNGNYTPQLPLPVSTDTTGTCPIKQGRPYFALNQAARTVTFRPNVYVPNVPAGTGTNKYQVVIEVNEWRRVNGVQRNIGRVRREAALIVTDCGTNTTPNPVTATNQTPNSNTGTINTTDTTQINVYSCNYSRVSISFTDPDNIRIPSANQRLTVTLPANINTDPNYLASGDIGSFVFSTNPQYANGSSNPRATFFFQPSPSAVGRTIRIPIRIEDDACPVKGLQNRVIVIKVLRGNFASAVAAVGNSGIGNTNPGSSAICAGGSLQLVGSVVRPDSIRRLATNTTLPQVYDFQWTTANNAGLPAVTNARNITVSPTVTTRYKLRIAPTLGFTQGACGDTTSILVRVVPPPVATATASRRQVCAGGRVVLRGTAARPAGVGSTLNDTYTYAWSGPGVQANTTGDSIVVFPTTRGINEYTLVANGAAPYGCAATTTVQVEVVAPPVVTAFASLPKVCAGAPVVLSASAAPASGSTFTDTYTYTWSGPGVAANATGATLTVRPLVPGVNTYTLTATGSTRFNCVNTTTVQVEVAPSPTIRVTTNNAFICPGGTATLQATAVAPPGLTDTYTFRFRPANGLPTTSETSANPTVRPTVTTRYYLTATGTSQFGCADTTSVLVRVTPAVVANFVTADSVGTNGQRTNRPPVFFTFTNQTVTTAPGQSPTTTFGYVWTYQRTTDASGGGVSEPATQFSTVQTPAPLKLEASGTYKIRLTTTATVAGAACPSSSRERIVIVPDVQVPNIITPNGDGKNDQFKISSAGTASKLEIYNRWGRKIYEQTNYQNSWEAEGQPSGTYFYLVTDRNGAQTKGWLEVVRN